MKTKSEQIIENGWGGDLTHELVGKILALSDEVSRWDEGLKFIGGVPREKEIKAFVDKMEDEINGNIVCPACGGDGKETCNNPDHGFIGAVGGDIGRIGCPCCGQDENFKVPNGGDCEICSGTGRLTQKEFGSFCEELNYDKEPIYI